MKRIVLGAALLAVMARPAAAQGPELKFIADTLVVQAEGTYEADPDLATLKFDVSSQNKDLKQGYDTAAKSMQRITELAQRTGLKKDDVSTGVLTVTPYYGGGRNRKAQSYLVQGQIALKVRDFSQIPPILDGAVEEGIVDFRSLTYSLVDEEVAKQHAVAEAMRRAMGRAGAALAEKGEKVGPLRFASLDVRQLAGVATLERGLIQAEQLVEIPGGAVGASNGRKQQYQEVLPQVRPEKITVSATVQCAFQIQ